MKKFTVLTNNFNILNDSLIGQNWQDNDHRYYMEFEGDDIEVRDEYHSMHELYQHRMALNIALFHTWKREYECVKSKLHNDGTMFDGYFIVMAITPVGQISYHYKLKHWNDFNLSEVERTPAWDGHTSKDVLDRLAKL